MGATIRCNGHEYRSSSTKSYAVCVRSESSRHIQFYNTFRCIASEFGKMAFCASRSRVDLTIGEVNHADLCQGGIVSLRVQFRIGSLLASYFRVFTSNSTNGFPTNRDGRANSTSSCTTNSGSGVIRLGGFWESCALGQGYVVSPSSAAWSLPSAFDFPTSHATTSRPC